MVSKFLRAVLLCMIAWSMSGCVGVDEVFNFEPTVYYAEGQGYAVRATYYEKGSSSEESRQCTYIFPTYKDAMKFIQMLQIPGSQYTHTGAKFDYESRSSYVDLKLVDGIAPGDWRPVDGPVIRKPARPRPRPVSLLRGSTYEPATAGSQQPIRGNGKAAVIIQPPPSKPPIEPDMRNSLTVVPTPVVPMAVYPPIGRTILNRQPAGPQPLL